ncbi:hypothetical protein AM501_06890 [Aneurinibacillus migulanus]|uniref:Uncharacterized protein n=1 Tax=Aneurinibacillus migulanus TaxID=47500 RepID=A0A0D1XSL8_ANEMI|nr:hypothetical protein [Aneurinibacillus migulanus]KIV50102.1 hypothetical protein TS65_30090 [Aneurinibacillus migulanus]KIV52692.1 hypothetical protein TS64_22100 [Aneurinibacillus migulanus]KON96128.1 hypothetical protein AF333_12180 [Aneurinibacillus migulanus]KPD08990.1 hypothetical protein AM501_06890 [Aneurinibacillus migulanus]MED0894612.1 hypothetical protein [Aneurinibacillus migulanus]
MDISNLEGKEVRVRVNIDVHTTSSSLEDRSANYYGIYKGHDNVFVCIKVDEEEMYFPIFNIVYIKEVK